MTEIRPAAPGDASGIRRVAAAAYHETYVEIVGTEGVERLLSAWYDPEDLRERLGTDPGRTFVVSDAEGDERVVGYAGGAVPEDQSDGDPVGSLLTLYVHPDRWGEGIGSRLFDRVRAHLADRGAAVMRISVFADNAVGREFYEDRAEFVAEREDHLEPLGRTIETAVYEVSTA